MRCADCVHGSFISSLSEGPGSTIEQGGLTIFGVQLNEDSPFLENVPAFKEDKGKWQIKQKVDEKTVVDQHYINFLSLIC